MGSNTILVVDDDDAVRRVVARILNAEGYQVIEAKDGAAALAALRESRGSIRVVVSDILMEGMDGVSLFENVSDLFDPVPFVFITGHADNERMVSIPTRYPVITKPFAPQALLTCIRQVTENL